ncbi:RING-type E3 ubiquitin transferase [Ranunculus cassubicifolius]
MPASAPSSSSSSLSATSNLLHGLHSRRLLLHTPLFSTDKAVPPSSSGGHGTAEPYIGDNSFDANIVMILSVLLCALICALGLNSIIRCALRCSTRASLDNSSDSTSTRLANTGVKRKALKTFPIVTYSADLKLPGLDSECSICLSEFTIGERLRVLPTCNHGFHLKCIDRWLISHSSCPTCRHCLIDTCHKIVGCSPASSSHPAPPLPLEPEELIRSYRGIC